MNASSVSRAVGGPGGGAALAPPRTQWKGRIGILGLIVAEISLFAVFVVAYLFYIGKSVNGPYPAEVLELPVLGTVLAWAGALRPVHGERVEIVSWYWHFVDAVWVVVFTVVYVIGR